MKFRFVYLRPAKRALGVIMLLGVGAAFLYQNCSKVAVSDSAPQPSVDISLPDPGNGGQTTELPPLKVNDYSVNAPFNTPVDFTYVLDVPNQNLDFSFVDPGDPLKVTIAAGTVEVLDLNALKFRYTPQFGFRGQGSVQVSFKDKDGRSLTAKLTLNVGNNLQHLQPALAVRSAACITCHTQISSNMITDFGYKGDGAGRDYYFGQNSPLKWNYGTIYGDHEANKANNTPGAVSTLTFLNSTSKVIVPMAPVTGAPLQDFGQDTLAKYIKNRLAASETANTRNTQVMEKSTVYIGAPTAAKIKTAFQIKNNETLKFFKETSTSPDLSGLTLTGGVYRNSGKVTCEGDLALVGKLYLENLQLSSKTGCRIYATESVFIYGPISYVDKTENTNLQITSARAIVMGTGLTQAANGQFCEPGGWYDSSHMGSSLLERFRDIWTLPSAFLRENKTPAQLGADVVADASAIEAVLGSQLMDASCRPEGRAVAFERLLLNAPQVHSRYNGNVKGVVISEFALMSLGNFKYEFDPVFNTNTVLPLISVDDFLKVE